MSVAFICKCCMCPQDFDIHLDGKYVGNVYERHGHLTIYYGDAIILEKDIEAGADIIEEAEIAIKNK